MEITLSRRVEKYVTGMAKVVEKTPEEVLDHILTTHVNKEEAYVSSIFGLNLNEPA